MQLKREIGGSQCEPRNIGMLMRLLLHGWPGAEGCAAAVSLCGAGAGGYAVCILKRGASSEDLRRAVLRYSEGDGATDVTVHRCSVDTAGVHSSLVREGKAGASLADEYQDLVRLVAV